jgi:hypothetical protein
MFTAKNVIMVVLVWLLGACASDPPPRATYQEPVRAAPQSNRPCNPVLPSGVPNPACFTPQAPSRNTTVNAQSQEMKHDNRFTACRYANYDAISRLKTACARLGGEYTGDDSTSNREYCTCKENSFLGPDYSCIAERSGQCTIR